MSKKLAILLFASGLIFSGAHAFAHGDDDDDHSGPGHGSEEYRKKVTTSKVSRVPDAGSTALMAGCAVAGLAGLRFFLKGRNE
jgi:hypothetical protein